MAPTVVFVYLAMSLFYSNENSNEFQSARELSGFCVHTLTITHHTSVTISAPRILHKNLWVYIKKNHFKNDKPFNDNPECLL